METTKLGLKIAKSYKGYGEGFGVNENPAWIKSVRDLRDDCKYVIGLEEDCDASVIMYSATPAGEFYTIVSKIAGRQTDFISAWIHCPLNIMISGADLSTVIEATRDEILANEVNENKLEKVFAKEYQVESVPKSCTSTAGDTYAVRYYGNGLLYSSLADLLTCDMSQPMNAKFKGIFLIDKGSALKGEGCTDISKSIMKDSFVIDAPKEDDGYTPYINGMPFKSPIRVTEGDNIVVVWKKRNFKDVQTESIASTGKTIIKGVSESDKRRWLRYSDIEVLDEDGRVNDEDVTIKVLGKVLHPEQQIPIHISNMASTSIEVTGKGYKNFKKEFDITKPITITLTTSSFVYECEIPLILDEGVKARCKATIDSNRDLDGEHCPIEGYRTGGGLHSHGTNILRYDPPTDKKKIAIISGIAFIAGLIIGLSTVYYFAHKKIDNLENKIQTEQQAQTKAKEKAEAERKAKDGEDAAVKYLDENADWVESEMEEYGKLKGVWAQLNSYQYSSLKERKDLTESNKFAEILNLFEALENAKGLNRLGQNYCDDGSINVNRYSSKLRNTKNDAESAANKPAKNAQASQPAQQTDNNTDKKSGIKGLTGRGNKK